jgi:hypothetical protein
MTSHDEIRAIRRTAAKSGKVDYADPLILNETSKSRLTAVAFFIPHSDHTEFSIKLEGFSKKAGEWMPVREKTLSIGEVGSRSLLQMLQTHLAVAEQHEKGEFILLRVSEGTASLGDHDPQAVARVLTKILGQPEIVQHLSGAELSGELSSALRGSIRLSEMRAAVAQLRQHLDNGDATEQTYQDWCTNHCWAFGNAYVMRDDVRAISVGDKLDLLLPNVIAGYRDIVELKRPDVDVLLEDRAHRNHYFSAPVSQAIGQCHRYLDILHKEAENGLLDHKEVVAYHPRAIIVIGRSNEWTEERQRSLHGLNRRLSGITVMTYDHLLAQGERLLAVLSPSDAMTARPAEDEDIPW